MPERDDSAVKIISTLAVDYSQAVKGVQDLAKAFQELNTNIQAVEKQFKVTAQDISQQLQNLGGRATTGQAQAAKRVIEQVTGYSEARLAQLERQLVSLEARARRVGVEIPGLSQRIEDIRSIRDVVRDGSALSEEQVQAVEAARQFATIQAQNLAILQREAELLTQTASGQQLLGDATSRRAVAAQLAAEAMSREAQAAADALPALNAQLANLQANLRLQGMGSSELAKQAEVIRAQVLALQERLNVEGKLTEAEVLQTKELQQQAKVLQANALAAMADARQSPLFETESMLRRRLSWFATGALAFGAVEAARQGLQIVGEIEMGMTELARVMDDPLMKIDQMRRDLFALGQEFGFQFQTVQDIALRWAQAGLDASQTLQATRASLLALNTAELDAQQATEALIGIMKQWGLSAADLIPLIDKINKVADDYAVSSQDLVDGLLRSSGAARNANMTLEQTIAILTAMKEASGRTGAEVGNALNSIIAYLNRAKSLETLEKAGIPVFADASHQKLRSTFDLLADLARNWDKLSADVQKRLMEEAESAGLFTEEIARASGALEQWTDLQRRDILQAGAGVYRRNYLLALLKNFSQVYEVLKTEEESLGYSMRENARTMETYQKKVEQLRAAWQELLYAVAEDGGLLDFLKHGADAARSLVDMFNSLPPAAQGAVGAIGAIAGTMGALNLASEALVGVSLADWFAKLRAAIGLTNPVLMATGLALGAVTLAVVQYNNHALRLQRTFEETKQAAEANIQAAEAEAKIHSQNALMLRQVADEYRALEKQRRQMAKEDPSQADVVAAKQVELVAKVREALGAEVAERLKAAKFSKQATEQVIQAEQEAAQKAREAAAHHIEAYKQQLQAQIVAAMKSLDVIETQQEGWQSYLTFTERMRLALTKIWLRIPLTLGEVKSWLHKIFADMLQSMANGFAKLRDLIGGFDLPDWLKDDQVKVVQFLNKAASGFSIIAEYERIVSRQYERAADSFRQQIQNTDKVFADKAAQRNRQLLAQLLQESMSLGQLTAGGGAAPYTPAPGQFGTGDDADKAKQKTKDLTDAINALIDAITHKVDALEREAEATGRLIDITEERISLYTREGASLAELQQADSDRAKLLDLITRRQRQLHDTAVAARQAIVQLREAQSKLNLSTEEGRKAYNDLQRAIDDLASKAGTPEQPGGSLSQEWLRLEQRRLELLKANNAVSTLTIRLLDQLDDKFRRGLFSLRDYVGALQRLERQAGLSAEALQKLHDAEAEALSQLWTQRIEDALEKGRQKVEDFGKTIDVLFRNVSRQQAARDLQAVLGELGQGAAVLDSLLSGGGVPKPTPLYVGRGLGEQGQQVAELLRNLLPDILGGRYAPNESYITGISGPNMFGETILALARGVADLSNLSDRLRDAQSRLAEEAQRVTAGFEAQVQAINDALKQMEELDRQARKQDALEELNRALAALRGEEPVYIKLPDVADVERLADAVKSIRLDDLGALSPEEFSKALLENDKALRGFADRAQEYLRQATDSVQLQLRDIDAQIAEIDRELQRDLDRLQAELDALDREEKQDQRRKAEEEYRAKLKALEDQRQWLLMTNKDPFALASVERQIADLQREWQDQQQQWAREDRREQIRQQMEDLRKAAEEQKAALEEQRKQLLEQQGLLEGALQALLNVIGSEREELRNLGQERLQDVESMRQATEEKYNFLLQFLDKLRTEYLPAELQRWEEIGKARADLLQQQWLGEENSVRALMNNGLTTVLADMAARDPEWQARGKAWIDNLVSGLESGLGDLQHVIDEINSALSQIRSANLQLELQQSGLPLPYGGGRGGASVPGFASGAYLTGRRGVLAMVGEGQEPEVVLPLKSGIPVLAQSMRQAFRSLQDSMAGMRAAALAAGAIVAQVDLSPVVQELRSLRQGGFQMEAAVPVVVQIGNEPIDRRVMRVIGGVRQVARTVSVR